MKKQKVVIRDTPETRKYGLAGLAAEVDFIYEDEDLAVLLLDHGRREEVIGLHLLDGFVEQ